MDGYKLVQRGSGLLGRYWIYQGSDHLLLLEQILFVQSYYRFFFRDIQGIMMRKTDRFWAGNLVIAFGFFLAAIRIYERKAGPWTIILIILFGLFALRHFIRGMTCKISIITEVQKKKLGGVQPLRKWRAMKKFLVPIIEDQQGRFSTEAPDGLSDVTAFAPAPLPNEN